MGDLKSRTEIDPRPAGPGRRSREALPRPGKAAGQSSRHFDRWRGLTYRLNRRNVPFDGKLGFLL